MDEEVGAGRTEQSSVGCSTVCLADLCRNLMQYERYIPNLHIL